MVMRRVFNHHVCLCVLSTAILAGLALMTSQTKVYAQPQNCKGLAGSSDGDDGKQLIVCDETGTGSGWKKRDGWGELTGNRTINMSGKSDKAAVTVTNSTKIRIKSTLTVTDSSGTGNNTAIKVHNKGVLKLVGGVNVTGVQKGVDVSGSGSSVTVMTGSIGVRAQGGGSLIEVKNSGKVVLMEGVTVTGSGSGEVVVINNGGTVELGGVQLKDVKTGIVVKGGGNANVKGGATITVKQGGTGFKMEGTATANVMDMTINGSGGGGNRTGVEMGSTGTLTMTKVGITTGSAGTGAKVTKGTLELNGGSTITVGQNGTGVEVEGGTANVTSTTIKVVGSGGKGLVMKGGTANVTLTRITGSGNGMGATGLEMSGNANVTLMGVTMNQVGTGITKSGSGTLTLNGGTKITGSGRSGVGINVTGGSGNVMLTGVTISEVQKGVEMGGSGVLKLDGDSKITVQGNGTGLNVSSGTVMMTGVTTINVAGNGTGMSVSNGTVMMNGTTTITVAAGGKGLDVSGGTVTMKGTTTITASGTGTTGVQMSGGEVMLEKVNISEFTTGITMTGGRSLKLDGGSIRGNNRGMGINVTKGGTVTVEGVEISKFATGINMEAGESLTVEGGRIEFAGGYGIKVGEKVQSTNLTGVTIVGKGSGGSGNRGVEVGWGEVMMKDVNISNVQTGVDIEAGVTGATLTDVKISGVEKGVYAGGSGELKVEGGEIQFKGSESYDYGVNVGSSVKSAELTDVTITGNGGSGSKGVWVKGGEVKLTRVNVSNVGTGVEMRGGTLTVKGMTTITGVEKGIYMEGSGTLTVEDKATIQFTGAYGIKVGGTVTRTELTGVEISGGGSGTGINVTGGNLTVKGMTTITGVERGIYMEGSGTLTVRDKTRIEFTGKNGYGVKVGKGVQKAELTDVTIEGQNKGVGVYAEGENLTVKGGTTITGVKVGIAMKGKGELKVEGGTRIEFEGEHEYEYGIGVGKSVSKATLTGVTITGKGSGGSGVFMMGGEVTMERVNVSQVATGVYAMGGVLMVSGGEIKGVEDGITMTGYGVLKVKDKTRIEFTGNYGYGVAIERGATATLTNVEIVGKGNNGGNGTGIYAMGGSLTVSGGSITGVKEGIFAVGGGTLTVKDKATIQFTGNYGVYVGKRVRSTSLMGVTIEGKGSGGYGVYVTGGNLTVIGGEIKEVEDGIMMMGSGELKVRDNTRIWFTKDYGVVVGESVRAHLKDVEIKGSGSGGSGGNGVGVYAMGGSLTVSGGSITGVEEGIKMMGGTLTVEKGARINFTGEHGYGIYVGKGVMANLMGVTIEGKGNNGSGYGVYAKNGEVTVSGGSIKGVKAGIFAVGGGSLTVEDSTRIGFTGSDGYGVYVGEKVRANLTDVTITGSGDGYGIEVMGGAMWLKGTHLRDVAKGMTISKGVTIMEKGSVEFTRDYGIDLTRGYAFLGGVNIKGKETGQEGIKVNEGMLDLYKTNVRDVYKGMTVWRGGIRMEGGEIEFMGEYGIDLTRGYAFLGEVNIEGKETGQEGIKVSEGMLNLYKTNVRDVYKGMTVKEGSVVRMFEGEITFKGEHAISLTKKGYVDLRNVNMTYKGDNKVKGANTASPNFIKVEGGKVLAEKLTMTGNGKDNIQGVKVANGGAVWLKNTTFSNVRSGMTVERGVLCAWREEVLPLQEAMVSVFQGGRLC
ncbi:beta strand repeat-containing protein [Bartonella schoenbuchensis]|uniref:beta strand repeat-containing protein n=1 Tax=Bartonella schoenbuchensis TaxID=165694 RepID=UPI0031456D9B